MKKQIFITLIIITLISCTSLAERVRRNQNQFIQNIPKSSNYIYVYGLGNPNEKIDNTTQQLAMAKDAALADIYKILKKYGDDLNKKLVIVETKYFEDNSCIVVGKFKKE